MISAYSAREVRQTIGERMKAPMTGRRRFMVGIGCQIWRGVHLFCRGVLFYRAWAVDLSGIRLRNGRRIDRSRGSLRVAFDMARSFPGGEEGRIEAVLMSE